MSIAALETIPTSVEPARFDARDLVLPPHEKVSLRSQSNDQLTVEATYAPVAGPSRRWVHPDQDERIEIISGSLNVRIGTQQHGLRAGDVIAIPRGTAHQVWNDSATPTRVLRRMSHPGRAADYFAAFNEVQNAGDAGVLQSSVLVTEFPDVVRAGGFSGPLMRGVLKVLGFLGRRRGYRAAGGSTPAAA
jgi:quercetin dioxygenase-like cupin family protein